MTILTILFSIFILGAACYLLFITSDPLEKVGGRIGKLLKLPEDVIASTFQALATSGPEIVMAVLAGFVAWEISETNILQNLTNSLFMVNKGDLGTLLVGEASCSGVLNMCFSAMDNLLGIGCLGMIFMMYKKYVDKNEQLIIAPSVKIGLIFYIVSSTLICYFLQSSSHIKTIVEDGVSRNITAYWLTPMQSWILMGIGIAFILSQFFLPKIVNSLFKNTVEEDEEDDNEEEEEPMPTTMFSWITDLFKNGFVYLFLVFGLIVFVRGCMLASFSMASVGIASLGGVLILFTSYVSSFPEFMLTYRYAMKNKKNALLAMLFGSNVIDLAFAGFRAIKLDESLEVYTTGSMQGLFPYYLWCLPALAIVMFLALNFKMLKYKHAFIMIVFYLIYVTSGFILL